MTSFSCSKMFSSFEEDFLLLPLPGKIRFYQPLDYHILNGIAIMVLSKININNLEENESTHMISKRIITKLNFDIDEKIVELELMDEVFIQLVLISEQEFLAIRSFLDNIINDSNGYVPRQFKPYRNNIN